MKEMYDLPTEMKSRRLHWGGKSSAVTWQYYRFLKEDDDTRRVLPVNPYAEVYQLRDSVYGILSDNLDGKGDVWMFLILGPEKAMLIDTSYGLGDQKGLVEELAGGRELVVVNTHDHYDHAYGNCRFGKVYCHEHLVPYINNQHGHMWDYVFDVLGNPIWVDFPREELPEFRPFEIVGVPDGYTWDLGDGHEIELIFTGGHCTGHAAYLDKRNRILFAGDNLTSDTCSVGDLPHFRTGPWADDGDMDVCLAAFEKLVARIDEYDYVFPQHHLVDLDKCVIPNIAATMRRILADPEDYDYKTVGYDKDRNARNVTYFKNIPGFTAIRYKYDKEKWDAKTALKSAEDRAKLAAQAAKDAESEPMHPVYREIAGKSVTKRIFFTNQPNPIVEAMWKRFREHSASCRVYDVNPNVEVYPFGEGFYGLYHPNCDGGGDVWMYLIVGEEKAFLVDTAYGLGDLRGLVDELSGGKELIVANTHLGPDHVFGNFRFDHVFCHEFDAVNIANKLKPATCFDYLFDKDGKNIWCQFDRKDLPVPVPSDVMFVKNNGEVPEIPEHEGVMMIGVPDHYSFDLGGGETIELIWTGGHMPGHAMYLDKKRRVLIGGDDVCGDIIGISGPKPFLTNCQYRNVQTYRDRLAELVQRADEFDYIFSGHFVGHIETHVLFDILDALNAIVEDPASYDYREVYRSGSGGSVEKMHKHVDGFGDIGYERDSVYPGVRDCFSGT